MTCQSIFFFLPQYHITNGTVVSSVCLFSMDNDRNSTVKYRADAEANSRYWVL